MGSSSVIHRWFVPALVVLALACGTCDADASKDSADPLDGAVRPLIQSEHYLDVLRITSHELATRLDSLGPDNTATLNCLRWAVAAATYGRDLRLAWQINGLLVDRLDAVAQPRDPVYLHALVRRGHILRVHGDRAGARRCWDRAESLLDTTRYDDRLLLSSIRQGQAWARRLEDQATHIDDAIALQREAFALCDGPSYERMDAATWLGWLLFQSGYCDEARPYLELARADAEFIGQSACFDLSVINAILAGFAVTSGDWPRAEALFHAAATNSEVVRHNEFPGLGRGSVPLHHYGSLAVCQLHQGNFDDAWSALQKSKAAVTTDFMRLSRMPYEVPGFESLCDTFYARSEAYDEFVDAHHHTAGAVRLIASKLEAECRVLSAQQEYLDRFRDRRVSIAQLQATLDSTTAYIGWASTYSGLRQPNRRAGAGAYLGIWAFVVRKVGDITWIPLVETWDVKEASRVLGEQGVVQEMLVDAARWPSRVGADPELTTSLKDVATEMFDPILPYLEGIDRLVIEFGAEGLFRIPLEPLVLPDGSYLGDRFATVYTPSAAGYVSCAESSHRASAPSMTALLIGAPADANPPPESVLAKRVSRPRNAAVDAMNSAPELFHARTEIDRIAGMFDSTVLEGKDASEERINDMVQSNRLRNFDIIHIAAHALDGIGAGGRSIVLTSRPATGSVGRIDIDEILYSWRLHAELVTLSACRTIVPAPRWGGEMAGLAQAMIGAGAHSVIGSSWDIDDEAAALFMIRFYEDYSGTYHDERMGHVREPMGKAEALREARMWLRTYRDADGVTPFTHPAYWSAYILVGNPD